VSPPADQPSAPCQRGSILSPQPPRRATLVVRLHARRPVRWVLLRSSPGSFLVPSRVPRCLMPEARWPLQLASYRVRRAATPPVAIHNAPFTIPSSPWGLDEAATAKQRTSGAFSCPQRRREGVVFLAAVLWPLPIRFRRAPCSGWQGAGASCPSCFWRAYRRHRRAGP